MGVYVQGVNGNIMPNSEAIYTAISRLKWNDAAGVITPSGFLVLEPRQADINYSFRGLGLAAFPKPSLFMPFGNIYAAKDTSQDGAGDYILPLKFYPIPFDIFNPHVSLTLLRATGIRVTPFRDQLIGYKGVENNDYYAIYKNSDYAQSAFQTELSHLRNNVPVNPPLVHGDIPDSTNNFNYDPGLIKIGIDKSASHEFFRAYTGINTFIPNPFTQADMAASLENFN